MMLDMLVECLMALGVSKASTETLKGFLYMNGPLEDVVNTLLNKGLSTRRKAVMGTLKKVLADLMEIKETSVIMGCKVRSLFVLLVKGIMLCYGDWVETEFIMLVGHKCLYFPWILNCQCQIIEQQTSFHDNFSFLISGIFY